MMKRINLTRADSISPETLTKVKPTDPQIPPTTKHLAEFDITALQGERLDPNNAFFPMIRAVGLFQTHRDADAIASLKRAGNDSRWDDYKPEELDVRIQLYSNYLGDRSALERVSLQSAILFPSYAKLRHLAFLATYESMTAERNGHPEKRFAIRNALMRIGSLMRVQ